MLTKSSDRAVPGIIGLSVVILLFLFWWIYQKEAPGTFDGHWSSYLPYLNAFLNGMAAVFLVCGFVAIKNKKIELHKRLMVTTTFISGLFLISYLTYHHFQGDTKFLGQGLIRYLYFGILISHILLSIVQVPLIFLTLYFAFTQKLEKHKKIARWTFPIWLYVSVTGVLIFLFLNLTQ